MPVTQIDSQRGNVTVEPARARQTERPSAPFRAALAGGVNVLMSGAEVATGLVAGPILAAAVHGARVDVVGNIAGAPPDGPTGAITADAGGGALVGPGGTGGPGSELTSAFDLQRQSQAFNLQFLNLQEEVQQENRRFTTFSNVIRARHETAKAAVTNIRP